MFSKVLIKLIDRAIVPATLLLTMRIVSIVLISRYLGFTPEVSKSGFVFERPDDYLMVNSYSTLFMVGLLVLGIAYIIIKSFAFHESHIKPALSAKLFSLRLDSIIQGSFHLYSEGVIWLSYAYLLLIVSAIMLLSNFLYLWVFWVTLAATIGSTSLFIIDVDEEIRIKKAVGAEYDDDKNLLSQEGLE